MSWRYIVAQVLGPASKLGLPTKEAGTSQLGAILNVVYLIAGGIAVLMVVLAGISYATSSGDANKLAKAKNTIIYAVAGLVVVGTAFLITNFIVKGVTG